MAASVTQNLKLGTGISLVTERDPILMAKQVATLDHLSNGRLVLGVGAGWNAEEMENHGTPFDKRWPILRERTLAMREIWCSEEAEFHGEFVDFDKIWSYPKPKQSGGPPILMGASSRFTYDRIAEYADGWMPIYQDHARRQASGGVDYAAGIANTRRLGRRAVATGNRVLASSALGQIVERYLNLLSWASIECFLHCLQILLMWFCHWWKNMPPSPTNFPLKSGMS